jgi:hypothetical protein
MENIKKYLLDRAREPSTWRGIIALATAVGVSLSTQQAEAIIATGLALAGLVAVFTPDA